MAVIGILTTGSRGDVQPYKWVAAELLRRGHTVKFATHYIFESYLSTSLSVYGKRYQFVPLPANTEEIARSPEFTSALRKGGFIRLAAVMRSKMIPHVDEIASIFFEMASGCDLLVGTSLHQIEAYMVAKKVGAKYVGIALQPIIATKEFSINNFLPKFLSCLNSFSFRLFEFLATQVDVMKSLRKKYLTGIPLPTHAELQKRTIIHTFSPHLLPPPREWLLLSNVHVVGNILPPSDDLQVGDKPKLDSRLEAFLADGAPPVYVGFGSMPIPNARVVEEMVVAAVHELKVRVIFCQSWAKDVHLEKEGHVLTIDSAPHSLLLPRCAAAVHHGGAGTTAASTSAGIPTVILPLLMDQYLWAEMVGKRGAGPKQTCPLRSVTPDRFVALLREALSPSCVGAAKLLGEKIRRETGVASTCDLIERELAE